MNRVSSGEICELSLNFITFIYELTPLVKICIHSPPPTFCYGQIAKQTGPYNPGWQALYKNKITEYKLERLGIRQDNLLKDAIDLLPLRL